MEELNFQLPQGLMKLVSPFHVKRNAQPSLLLVAGGRQPQNEWLRYAAKDKAVYCADLGAAYCLEAELVPAAVYGDGDSADSMVYEWAEKAGAALRKYPPAKDDTDLQLLLAALPEGDLLATGIWGGRFDHLYSNVFSLLAFKEQRKCQVLLADDKEIMLLLSRDEQALVKLEKARGR